MLERGRGRQIQERPEVRVEGAGEGQTLFPGTLPPPWRGRSTWIRAAGPAGPRSKSSRYSSSDFWLSSPEPRHHLRNLLSTITFTANEPGTFPLYFTDPPKNTVRRCSYYTPWLKNWSSDKSLVGHMACKWRRVQTQVVWCPAPLTMTPVNCGAVAFQTFGSVIYSRKCILYWLRYSIQPWNNIFHKETLCWILETSSDCPVFHTKILIRDHLVDFTTNCKWLIDWKALVKTNVYLNSNTSHSEIEYAACMCVCTDVYTRVCTHIHIEPALIICGFCICEFPCLLKFIYSLKISPCSAFTIICRCVQSRKASESRSQLRLSNTTLCPLVSSSHRKQVSSPDLLNAPFSTFLYFLLVISLFKIAKK